MDNAQVLTSAKGLSGSELERNHTVSSGRNVPTNTINITQISAQVPLLSEYTHCQITKKSNTKDILKHLLSRLYRSGGKMGIGPICKTALALERTKGCTLTNTYDIKSRRHQLA